MPTRLHLFPITQNALNHLMLNPVTQAEIIQRIQHYAPSSQGDWDHATYFALGTQAKVTAYVQSIPLLNLASGSAYTRIVNADDWTIRQALAICGVPEPSGNLRAIVINDQDQQSVVLDQRMNTPPHNVSSDLSEATNPLSCVNNCLNALGIPSWLIGVAGAVCAVVCAATDLIACPECLYGVLGGYAGELSFCLGACGL